MDGALAQFASGAELQYTNGKQFMQLGGIAAHAVCGRSGGKASGGEGAEEGGCGGDGNGVEGGSGGEGGGGDGVPNTLT